MLKRIWVGLALLGISAFGFVALGELLDYGFCCPSKGDGVGLGLKKNPLKAKVEIGESLRENNLCRQKVIEFKRAPIKKSTLSLNELFHRMIQEGDPKKQACLINGIALYREAAAVFLVRKLNYNFHRESVDPNALYKCFDIYKAVLRVGRLSLPWLMNLYFGREDVPEGSREFAIQCIVSILGLKESIPFLLKGLLDPRGDVRFGALGCIRKYTGYARNVFRDRQLLYELREKIIPALVDNLFRQEKRLWWEAYNILMDIEFAFPGRDLVSKPMHEILPSLDGRLRKRVKTWLDEIEDIRRRENFGKRIRDGGGLRREKKGEI